MNVLVIDVGGTHVKVLASGHREPREFPSSKRLGPDRMVEKVLEVTKDWEYEAVILGYPGLVGSAGPKAEPENLGPGWVGFNFEAAFGRPVKVVNDAAMQALGSYEGGRMLFLGLGTSVGSTLVAGSVLIPLELGQLPYREATIADYLGREALKRRGDLEWQEAVCDVASVLKGACAVDYVVIGGGNAKKLKGLPEGVRLGGNENAFRGGFRLWEKAVAPPEKARAPDEAWKVV